jgi:hypothetical protein
LCSGPLLSLPRCHEFRLSSSQQVAQCIGALALAVPALLRSIRPIALVRESLFGALGKRKGRVSAGFCGTAVILGHIGPLFGPIQPLFGLFGPTFGPTFGPLRAGFSGG